MVRVLYLSQWCSPEPANQVLKVANKLISRGHDVEALTGFPNYPSGKLAPGYRLKPYQSELMDGIKVHRVWLYPSHDRSTFGRVANYVSFFVSSLIFLLANGRSYDVIYVYHPPILPALAAAISGLITRRPFIIEVQDLWPDSVATAGMRGGPAIARLLGPICRYVYRRAALVLGQSEGMAARLVERGSNKAKTDVFFNWADEDAARANGLYDTSTLNFEGRFNFVYAGNLGIVQALDVLIDAAGSLQEIAPEIQLTLIGDGVDRARLEALIRTRGVTNVQILPAVPATHIGDVLAAADVQILHLQDDPLFDITIPSKTQFYLAMGKPILIGVRGESARIVTEAGAGLSTPPDDREGMAKTMAEMAAMPAEDLRAMGERGRAAYAERFTFDGTMSKIGSHIEHVAAKSKPSEARSGELLTSRGDAPNLSSRRRGPL